VDLAAVHSDNIISTPSTTFSDNIDTTRVLAVPASSGTTTFTFRTIRYENIFDNDYSFWINICCSIDYVKSHRILIGQSSGAYRQLAPDRLLVIVHKNHDEQSNQSLPDQANYWSNLPTHNRTYLDFLLETDEEKAIKEFEKFVEMIEKKKVKKKEPEDA